MTQQIVCQQVSTAPVATSNRSDISWKLFNSISHCSTS